MVKGAKRMPVEAVNAGRLSLLDCALLAIRDECPPETCMYYCRFGEDDTADCERCWDTYLRYVADGRRGDPYASFRIDAEDNDCGEGYDEDIAEGGYDPYEHAAWEKEHRRPGWRRRHWKGPKIRREKRCKKMQD